MVYLILRARYILPLLSNYVDIILTRKQVLQEEWKFRL